MGHTKAIFNPSSTQKVQIQPEGESVHKTNFAIDLQELEDSAYLQASVQLQGSKKMNVAGFSNNSTKNMSSRAASRGASEKIASHQVAQIEGQGANRSIIKITEIAKDALNTSIESQHSSSSAEIGGQPIGKVHVVNKPKEH